MLIVFICFSRGKGQGSPVVDWGGGGGERGEEGGVRWKSSMVVSCFDSFNAHCPFQREGHIREE